MFSPGVPRAHSALFWRCQCWRMHSQIRTWTPLPSHPGVVDVDTKSILSSSTCFFNQASTFCNAHQDTNNCTGLRVRKLAVNIDASAGSINACSSFQPSFDPQKFPQSSQSCYVRSVLWFVFHTNWQGTSGSNVTAVANACCRISAVLNLYGCLPDRAQCQEKALALQTLAKNEHAKRALQLDEARGELQQSQQRLQELQQESAACKRIRKVGLDYLMPEMYGMIYYVRMSERLRNPSLMHHSASDD